MTLQELADRIIQQAAPEPHQVTLNDATLERAGVDALIQQTLLRSAGNILLIVDPDTIPTDPANSGFSITGFLPLEDVDSFLNLKDNSVEVHFVTIDGIIEFQLDINLNEINGGLASWALSDSFTNLKGMPFEQVNFSSSHFIFSTYTASSEGNVIETGLKLSSSVSLAGPFSDVEMLLRATNNEVIESGYQVEGLIEQTIQGTQFQLRGTLNLPSIDLSIMQLEVPYLGLSLTPYQNENGNLTDLTMLYLGGLVNLQNSEGTAVGLDVLATMPYMGSSAMLTFTILPQSTFETSLSHLGSLIGGSTWDDFFSGPANVLKPYLDTFGLRFFATDVMLSPFKIFSWQLDAGTLSPWTVLENLVVLNFFNASWQMVSPNATATETLTLEGELKLFDDPSYLFDAYIEIPNLFISCSFIGDLTFSIGNFLDNIAAAFDSSNPVPDYVQSMLTEFTLNEIYLFEDIPANYIGLNCQGNLAVASGDLEFRVSVEVTNDGASYSYTIGGALIIAGVTLIGEFTSEGFIGETSEGQEIPIGDLIEDMVNIFGEVNLPAVISDLTIENLKVFFDTDAANFQFTGTANFPINDNDSVAMTVSIACLHDGNGGYTNTLSGHIEVAGLQFDMIFIDGQDDLFLASYSGDTSIGIKALVEDVSSTVAGHIPTSLTLALQEALFVYYKATSGKFFFSLDIGADFLNLSNLPLVGAEFTDDQTAGVDDLLFVVASEPFTAAETTTVKNLPEVVMPLPDGNLNHGVAVTAVLRLGSETETINLQLVDSESGSGEDTTSESNPEPQAIAMLATTTTETNTSTNSVPATPADNALWYTLQKSFGPVDFERIGISYHDNALWFLLDASLSAANITFALDGLALGSPLDDFKPQFDLQGIGLDYASGPMAIGGSFLQTSYTDDDGNTVDDYEGAAVLQTEDLALAALGAYTGLDGDPSMFVYAVLDKALGGPSFFFVTGLAAGFGYNRALTVPEVDAVETFPLVDVAINGTNNPDDLLGMLDRLSDYITASVGDYFLAVGVKFNSFKMIDSFALLTAVLGDRFELDLLGISSLIVPVPEPGKSVTSLAEVKIAFKASYVPDEGYVAVSGQLTNDSYILSKKCHLTGGFAFYSWFSGDHEGDFVCTLGGYHPGFQVPSHYPQPPRLGYNWQVDSNLSVTGDAYFAITASALMAGGSLDATWEDGSIKAWFKTSADFLIAWQPYHYSADMKVNVGVSYTYHAFGTHHITADVGANLSMWGPEFSGKAKVDISVVSFTIRFGHDEAKDPQAVDWATFKSAFLPEEVCSIVVGEWLQAQVREGDRWLVNPKWFTLRTNSVIPSKTYDVNAEVDVEDPAKIRADFGIAPMEVPAAGLQTNHTITITHVGEGDVTDQFYCIPILKKMPAALWGDELTPSVNGNRFIENVLAGFTIQPAEAPMPGETHDIDQGNLQYSTENANQAYQWQTIPTFTEAKEEQLPDSIKPDADLLKALNLSEVSEYSVDDAFLFMPQIEAG